MILENYTLSNWKNIAQYKLLVIGNFSVLNGSIRKILHIKEITWCRKHADIIENKVKQLYELCTTESNYKGKNRCLKFKELELVCNEYDK